MSCRARKDKLGAKWRTLALPQIGEFPILYQLIRYEDEESQFVAADMEEGDLASAHGGLISTADLWAGR
jgi:hypothetical protein